MKGLHMKFVSVVRDVVMVVLGLIAVAWVMTCVLDGLMKYDSSALHSVDITTVR